MTTETLPPGGVRVYRNDEMYCVWDRHGIAHAAHEWRYARTDRIGGGIATGSYYCDGLSTAEAARGPWPERPIAVDVLRRTLADLPHPQREHRPGLQLAIDILARLQEPR